MVLASIHSEDEWENAKVAAANANCNGACGYIHPPQCDWFWLGASFDGFDWVWVDGTEFDYHPEFFEVNGDGTYLSGWGSVSCYGKGNGWHDAPTNWRQMALCEGMFSLLYLFWLYIYIYIIQILATLY